MMRTSFIVPALAALGLAVAGCSEKTEQKAEEAVNAAGNDLETAAAAAGEVVDKSAEAVGTAAAKAGDAVQDAAKDTATAAREGAANVEADVQNEPKSEAKAD